MTHVDRATTLFLLLLGLSVPAALGASTDADSTRVAVDSADVTVRAPADTMLARYRSDPAYDYDQSPRWTWWTDLQQWIRTKLSRLFGRDIGGEGTIQIGFYVILALIVGYAVYMLVQLRSAARAPARRAPESVTHPQTAEEMHAIDYDELVDEAVAEGRLRRAVQLLYQKTLQQLDRADAITWKPGKTNRTYVDEITAPHGSAFATLTREFERVWYGGVDIDRGQFEALRAQFVSFWEREHAPEPVAASTADSHGTPAGERDGNDFENPAPPTA